MKSDDEKTGGGFGIETELTRLGRNPRAYSGFVNTPIVRGSTVLFPDAETLETRDVEFTYGRPSNPTTRALETALAKLEGGARTFLTPSGLSAIAVTLLSFAEAGGHMLISDSVYQPTRRFAGRVLKRMGVDIEYYDPLAGGDIASLLRQNTKLVLTEFARLADLRNPGHPGDLPRGARRGRARRHRQYLGHAALFPRLRAWGEYFDPIGDEIHRGPCRRAARRRSPATRPPRGLSQRRMRRWAFA